MGIKLLKLLKISNCKMNYQIVPQNYICALNQRTTFEIQTVQKILRDNFFRTYLIWKENYRSNANVPFYATLPFNNVRCENVRCSTVLSPSTEYIKFDVENVRHLIFLKK